MHQSVVEYDLAPATMTAVSAGVCGLDSTGHPAGRAGTSQPAAKLSPLRLPEWLASYVTAAGIAAGLVATWAALCVI